MRRALLAAVSVMTFAFLTPQSRPQTLCDGFLPPNDMKIPERAASSKDTGGLTKAQFNQVLDQISALYGPIIEARGGTLQINRLWKDATVNASAQRTGSTYILNMYGGLARHEAITQDGFTLVVCHEMSHHLGGAPKIDGEWASNEGQADYAGVMKCMRRVFSNSASRSFTRMSGGDPVLEKACADSFSGSARALCARTATAGMSVTALFKALHHETTDPRFDTPDPSVVEQTDDSHPATQCRLDTYFQGSICKKPVSEEVSDDDPAAGTCTRSQGFDVGLRPLCWYKPPASERMAEIARFGAPAQRSQESLAKSGAFVQLRDAALWQGL